MKYQSLDHALKYFRVQVMAGVPWVQENLPTFETPKQIFDWLKKRTEYKNDPKGMELFQKIQTLLTSDNFHGIVGAGDCDCFTIAILTVLIANGFFDCGIDLAGRSPIYPVHIWAVVWDKGTLYNMDLTNKRFDQTRYYPRNQIIKFKLNPTEKQMILQLAEGGQSLTPSRPPQYIYLASKGVYALAQQFDHLSANEFQTMCLSEGVSINGLKELSAGRSSRKMEKAQVKAFKKQNKPSAIRRAQAQTARQERKTTRLDKKQFMTGAERAATVGNIVKGASSITGAIVSKGQMPQQQQDYNTIPSQYFDTSVIPDYNNDNVELVYAEEIPNDEQEVEMSEPIWWMAVKANKGKILTGLGVLTLIGLAVNQAANNKRA